MSTVLSPTPSHNFLRPAPEPPPSTTGDGNSKFSPNASATMVAYGRTVDEPVTCTLSLANAVVDVRATTAATVSNVFIFYPFVNINARETFYTL